MWIAFTILLGLSAAWWFVRIGKALNKKDVAEAVLETVSDIHEMEIKEDGRTRNNIEGGTASANSIALQFPGLPNVARKRRRNLSELSGDQKPDP
jgi:hypothetical protein